MEEQELHHRKRKRGNSEDPKTTSFNINDHGDALLEILMRLDARSLGVAACVCKLWSGVARNDNVWEHLCFRRRAPPSVRSLVVSLGGFRRLYMVCVEPAFSNLRLGRLGAELTRRVWTRHGAQLALSLFCVDYYERLGGAAIRSDASTVSLMFLRKTVNV